jgi:pyruvate,water dikinase
LEEVAKSAWYRYFDELGFDPMPRARMVRQHEGQAYLNLTLSAQRDAEQAAVEPLTLLVNKQPFPLAKWEKPGLLAAIKVGRNRKKIEQLLENYRQQVEGVTQKAAAWYAKTQDLRWSQADILQIMEEVERVSIPSFTLFLAARHNLELLCNRLLWATQERQPFPANRTLLQQALAAVDGAMETQMSAEALMLVHTAAADQATINWLRAGQYDQWQTTMPNRPLAAGVTTFLKKYGHRALTDGEMSQPRWEEAPALLFTLLCDAVQNPPPASNAKADAEPLLAAVAPDQRKVAQQQVQQARQLLWLQSQAVHAFAYILTGTRRWALAAAKEAQGDQRLVQTDDVFFFQLEEVKQMMTGEWNISSRQTIRNTCVERKAAYARWQMEAAPSILIGDVGAQEPPAALLPLQTVGAMAVRFWEKSRISV